MSERRRTDFVDRLCRYWAWPRLLARSRCRRKESLLERRRRLVQIMLDLAAHLALRQRTDAVLTEGQQILKAEWHGPALEIVGDGIADRVVAARPDELIAAG